MNKGAQNVVLLSRGKLPRTNLTKFVVRSVAIERLAFLWLKQVFGGSNPCTSRGCNQLRTTLCVEMLKILVSLIKEVEIYFDI